MGDIYCFGDAVQPDVIDTDLAIIKNFLTVVTEEA